MPAVQLHLNPSFGRLLPVARISDSPPGAKPQESVASQRGLPAQP